MSDNMLEIDSPSLPDGMYICKCAKIIEADIDIGYEDGTIDRTTLFDLWLESTGNCSDCYFKIYNKIQSLREQDNETI